MKVRSYARIMGFLYLFIGVLGFVPGAIYSPHPGDPRLVLDVGYGRLFNLLPVNVLHNLIHIAIGAWALGAARDASKAQAFARASAIVFGVLAVLGLLPGLNTFFGIMPIFGQDVWLNALSAAASVAVGQSTARHRRVA
jgi:hypothetical protein